MLNEINKMLSGIDDLELQIQKIDSDISNICSLLEKKTDKIMSILEKTVEAFQSVNPTNSMTPKWLQNEIPSWILSNCWLIYLLCVLKNIFNLIQPNNNFYPIKSTISTIPIHLTTLY